MPKINVLHVTVRLSVGGIERWLIDVLKHHDSTKFQMDVLCVARRPDLGPLVADAVAAGANIFYISLLDPFFLFKYYRLLKKQRIEAVIVHLDLGVAPVVILGASMAGVRQRILMIHSSRPEFNTRWGIFKPILRAFYLKSCSRIAGVSQAVLDEVFPGWRTDPLFTILYLGVDLKKLNPSLPREDFRNEIGVSPEVPLIGHFGRFAPVKNHRGFLETALEIHKQMPSVHFVLAGEGPLRSEIESLAQEYGLDAQIHFLGLRDDVGRILSALDMVYYPSLYEGFPVSFIEAQIMGVPVVTGFRPEFIEALCPDNVEYLTIDTSNPESAAKHICFSLMDHQLMMTISERGKTWAQNNFAIECSIANLQSLIVDGYVHNMNVQGDVI